MFMPQTIKILHFSPTGGTRRVALLLAKGIAPNVREYDLCDPQAEPTVFHPDDVALVAGPCLRRAVAGHDDRRHEKMAGQRRAGGGGCGVRRQGL